MKRRLYSSVVSRSTATLNGQINVEVRRRKSGVIELLAPKWENLHRFFVILLVLDNNTIILFFVIVLATVSVVFYWYVETTKFDAIKFGKSTTWIHEATETYKNLYTCLHSTRNFLTIILKKSLVIKSEKSIFDIFLTMTLLRYINKMNT